MCEFAEAAWMESKAFSWSGSQIEVWFSRSNPSSAQWSFASRIMTSSPFSLFRKYSTINVSWL